MTLLLHTLCFVKRALTAVFYAAVFYCYEGNGIIMKKVAVIMGSDSDFPIVKNALAELKKYGVEFECRVMSAHRTPEMAAQFAKNAKSDGFGVIICAAGMAAHLAGVIAGNTTLPVIGIPIKSTFEGLDALLATVQMPSGIPVATVGVNAAENAGLLALQILGIKYPEISVKLKDYKAKMRQKINADDVALQKEAEQL